MAEIDEATPGVFNWVDLMSPDVDASKAFYTEVFGWDAEDQFDEDGETRVYVMFSRGGRTVAGLGGQMPGAPDGMPPVWNSYVATADAAATTAAVEAAGGTVVMPPMQVFDSGVMAVFAAPDGAIISTWQPMGHIGAEVANEDGTWIWNELLTRDLDAALPFYADVFGWSYEGTDMGPAGTYHTAQVDGHDTGGLTAMPPGMPEQVPNHWAVYFAVDDLDATAARITAAGGQLVSEPMSAPGVGTFATAHDPQGGSFALLQPEQG